MVQALFPFHNNYLFLLPENCQFVTSGPSSNNGHVSEYSFPILYSLKKRASILILEQKTKFSELEFMHAYEQTGIDSELYLSSGSREGLTSTPLECISKRLPCFERRPL